MGCSKNEDPQKQRPKKMKTWEWRTKKKAPFLFFNNILLWFNSYQKYPTPVLTFLRAMKYAIKHQF